MIEEKSLLIVTVSGPDRPGITARFTHVLWEHRVEVIDMEQASLQDLLGLYFLLDLSTTQGSKDSVIKDLLFEASRLDLVLHFRLFSELEMSGQNEKNLFVLTHFGGTQAISEFSNILSEENVNIETISTLSHHGARSMEMVLDAKAASSLSRLKHRLMTKSRELGVDLAVQKMEAYRKNKRMIFFDMDSTLIDAEIIDEMARKKGVHREVSRITEKAMRGDIDFEEALAQRLALLKGLSEKEIALIRDSATLSQGADELIRTLKYLGYRVGIVTGGFDYFADHFRETLRLDFSFANQLEIKEGFLTGKLVGDIVDAAGKARIVNQVSCETGIPLDQVVVVGDGANDAIMIGQAGLGIAYNSKVRLDKVANGSLGKSRLNHLYHLLGITDADISEAACKGF